MTAAGWVIALVALQRLLELAIAARNTARLAARGAVEVGAGHYPLIVAVHVSWLATLALLGWSNPVAPAWLGVYLVLQLGRIWVMASLGERWTTRILVLRDAPPVRRGPYRFLRHPNYLIVAGEIAALPLALNLPWAALGFSLANGLVLAWRIRVEERALAERPGG